MKSILEVAEEWARPARILIVEDEPDVVTVLRRYLDPFAVESTVEYSSGSALHRLARETFDLIFIDLLLRDGSGVDVIQEARRRNPSVPIVVISGCIDGQMIEDAHKAGIVSFLRKPHDFNAAQVQALLTMFKIGRRQRPIIRDSLLPLLLREPVSATV